MRCMLASNIDLNLRTRRVFKSRSDVLIVQEVLEEVMQQLQASVPEQGEQQTGWASCEH